MLYLKVSSSVLIAVILICIIQNAISLTIDHQVTDNKWSTLETSTDQKDLKKISNLCKLSLNNFNEKLVNTKNIANKKLPEPNKTTEDIANLVSEIKTQVKNASADLVTVRKLVQKAALRFRDTFKSLISFTELDNEFVNKELESIQKTTVDKKKPLVNRVIRSFGNRYDLNKLANKVLEISSDHEHLKNDYNGKKKIVTKEFNSLWNSLSNHSKTMNDNALNALNTFFEGIKSVKNVKKKVKTLGENALDEIKIGDDIIKLKNAVELAKSLKLKFEDEWNLDSGELTYSEEQKKSSLIDENQSYVQENEQDKSNENVSINDTEPGLPENERKLNEFYEDKKEIIQPEVSNKNQNVMDEVELKSDSSIQEASFSPDINNNEELIKPFKDLTNNIRDKRTSREKTSILSWENLIQLNNPRVSQQSMKCKNLLNNITTDFDNIKNAAKTSIQATKNYKNLQLIENDTIKQLYDKMVDTNMKLCDYLVEAADNVCVDITPINKRYETKFKNDPNIKRIKYLLGKQYDPNQYILKILSDAKNGNGIGGMKKTTYYKMLVIAYNLNHETQEMENAALYAMNKIYEGQTAVNDLQKKFNKEKASKACFIKNILLEKENEEDSKNKEENKEKVNKCINDEDTNKEPFKPEVNLDSVDALQLPAVNDDGETIENNNESEKISNENSAENSDPDISNNADNKRDADSPENLEHEKIISIEENITHDETDEERTLVKPKVEHIGKMIDPKDGNEKYEEYETSDEKGNTNLNKSTDKNFNHIETSNKVGENNSDKALNPELSDHNDDGANDMVENEPEISIVPKDQNDSNEYGKNYDDMINRRPKTLKTQNPDNNIEDVEPENMTGETVDLGDNENLNSVEGAELKRIKNENILPTAESMEEDSSSIESIDVESEKNYPDESNQNDPKRKTYQNNSNQPNNISKHLKKQKKTKNAQEISGELNTDIPLENESRDDYKNNETPNKSSDQDTRHINNGEHDSETPEYNHSMEQAPEPLSHEELEEPNDTNQLNDADRQPKTMKRGHGRRKDNKDGNELPEDNNTDETPEHGYPDDYENIETPSENPDRDTSHNNDVEHDSETPEYNHSMEQAPEPLSHEELEEPNDSNQLNDTDRQPKTMKRRHGRRKDNKDGNELPEDNNTDETPEHGYPDDYENFETPIENPDHDTSHNNDGEHDSETPEYNHSMEQAQGLLSHEELEEPNDSNQLNDSDRQPKTMKRRHGRRKDNKDGNELPEDNNTDESPEHESPDNYDNFETPSENPDHDTSHNNDGEHDSETPEYNHSMEQAPEPLSHEELEEPNDTYQLNDADRQTKTMKRRHGRRKDNKDGNELPEDNNTDESPEHESPDDYENFETPSENPDHDTSQNNDVGHDSETPEYYHSMEQAPGPLPHEELEEPNDSNQLNDADRQPKTMKRRHGRRKDNKDGNELPEDNYTDETPEHESPDDYENFETPSENPGQDTSHNNDVGHDSETPEYNHSMEQAPEPLSHDELEEPNDSNQLNDADRQPKTMKRRHGRQKDNKDGNELPEDNNTDETPEHESPDDYENFETPIENPDHDTSHNNDGEHDSETPEYNHSMEQAPGPLSHEELEEPNDSNHLNDADRQPKTMKRRHGRRKDNKDGNELPEDNNTDESPEHESPDNYDNFETPSENPDHDTSHNNDVRHDSETPEYNHSMEQAPGPLPHEELEEPNDSNQLNDADRQPKTMKRRHGRRKDNKDGNELPEDNYTDETPEHESPDDYENFETPSENPGQDTSHNNDVGHDSETPEYNHSMEQAPGPLPHEELEEPNDSNLLNDADRQPKTMKRRHGRRKDNKDGNELPEDNYTDETPEHESPDDYENFETPSENPGQDTSHNNDVGHDSETPEYNHSMEQAPEPLSHDELEEPNDSNQLNDADRQPKTMKRRHGRQKDNKDGNELPEDNNTDETPEHESPDDYENFETPIENPDHDTSHNNDGEHDSETPEYNHSMEQAPGPLSHEELEEPNDSNQLNDADRQPKTMKRRHGRRKDNKDGNELPEDNSTDETPEHESPDDYENFETPSENPGQDTSHNNDVGHDSETPEYNHSMEQAPGPLPHEELEEPNDSNQLNDADRQPKTMKRRHGRRKDNKDGNELPEDNNTDESPEHESPDDYENFETPSENPGQDTSHNNDVGHDSETPEYNHSMEQTPEPLSHDELEEPNDSNQLNDADRQPKTMKRRHGRRKDNKDGNELPEDNYTDETPEHESPDDYENFETPSENPGQDTSHNNDVGHDSETPEYNHSMEQAPGPLPHEELEEPNDSNQLNDADRQPKTMKRRHGRRKDNKDGNELPEDNNTDESPEHKSPDDYENFETPSENPGQDTSHNNDVGHDSETPEYNHSMEQTPEPLSHDELEEPNDSNQLNDTDRQPKTMKRRHGRQKDNKDGNELPEDNNTDETPEHESPDDYENFETPIENPDHDTSHNNDGEHDSETPEYNHSMEQAPGPLSHEELEEPNDSNQLNDADRQPKTMKRRHGRQKDNKDGNELPEDNNTDETPEHESPDDYENFETPIENPDHDTSHNNDGEHDSETPEYNHSMEQAPGPLSHEELEEPNDSNQLNDAERQPKTMKRRHGRRKDNKDGNELPEDNNTDESPEHESPDNYDNFETPSENPDHDTSHNNDGDHDSETPEYNHSMEQAPEPLFHEELEEPNDTYQLNDADRQPKTMKRRHGRRKDNKDGNELPEDNNTDESPEHESPDNYDNFETPSENPDHDTSHNNDVRHDSETPEYNHSMEQAPGPLPHEELEEPNDSNQLNDADRQPKTMKRRHERRKDNKDGNELPEDNKTDETPEYESPDNYDNFETPSENPDHDTSHNNDGEHDSETPEYNYSMEQAPEPLSHEELEEPNDSNHLNDADRQPKTMKRRHGRRKDNKDGNELPEDNNTDESPEHESPDDYDNFETPSENPDHDTSHNNDGEHDSETPEYYYSMEQAPGPLPNEESEEPNDTNQLNDADRQPKTIKRRHGRRKDKKDGNELPEDYNTDETPEHESPDDYEKFETPSGNPDQETIHNNYGEHDSGSPEYNQSLEQSPERISYEDLDEPNDSNQLNDVDRQPNPIRRRHRRRKNNKDGNHLPEDYNTDETPEHESPDDYENFETPSGNPDQETIHNNHDEHDSGSPEYNQSLEQSPERISYEDLDEPNDSNQLNDVDRQPNPIRRRHRRRKNNKDGNNLPEDYNTDETPEHESPDDYENFEAPTENPGQDTIHNNDGEHDSGSPEYNQAQDHSPERISYEDLDEPNDSNQLNDVDRQPNTMRRRHRRRKNNKDGNHLPEDYNTDETPEHESPDDYENFEAPSENPGQDTIHNNDGEHDSGSPEYNQAQDQSPERISYEDLDEPNDSNQLNDVDRQPNTMRRRHRRRKNNKDGNDLPEDYNTDETPEHDSPDDNENFETPSGNPGQDTRHINDGEHDSGSPEYNHAQDHSPERISYEDLDEPNDSNQLNDVDRQPNMMRRRHRRRKNNKDGNDLPEDYNTDETREHDIPDDNENFETPSGNPGQDTRHINDGEHDSGSPEYNQAQDQSPERISYEDLDEPNDSNQLNDVDRQPNTMRRRHRRRKNNKDGNDLPEDYNTDETPEHDTPDDNENFETPSGNPGQDTRHINDGEHDSGSPEYNHAQDHSPERISYEDLDEPNNSYQLNDVHRQPNPMRRRYRRRKNNKDGNHLPEDYNTDETPEHESPDDYENFETPSRNPGQDTRHINDGEHDSETPEYTHSMEQSPEPRSHDELEEPNDSNQLNDVDRQPKTTKRRYKRRKNNKDGNDLPEVYNTDETPEHVSPDDYDNFETPIENPGQDTRHINDGEHDSGSPEYNQAQDQSPERISYEDLDEPNDSNQLNDVDRHPNTMRRRHRRRKDNKDGNDLPEDYDTNVIPKYESPEIYDNIGSPMYSDIEIETPRILSSNVVDIPMNAKIPRLRKVRHPKTFNENYNEPEVVNDRNANYSFDNNNCPCHDENNLCRCSNIHSTRNSKYPRRKKNFSTKKNPSVDIITPYYLDEYGRIKNDEKSVRNLQTPQNYAGINQKKKRHLKRIITYKVNKATNERIKVDEQTYSTSDELSHTPKNKLESIKTEVSDDLNTNKNNNDYSSFLFKEYNTDQCKRDAYDRFKKVHSQNTKDIAYQIILDTNNMRSNILATVKNALGKVKVSKTLNDVDQSLRTVSNSLKTGLKQTVRDLVTKLIRLAKGFWKTVENLSYLYKNGPQTTYKMLSNILKNESTIPDSAKDVLKLISPQFDVDELINNILEKPFNTKTLNEKKAKAQRRLINLSKHMDTAISNIDCCVLSAMSIVGIGAETLKVLKSGRVIMNDNHPRVKALRDAVAIIKSGKKIINNNRGFTSKLIGLDGSTENDKYNDGEDPQEVAQKNEDILNAVPDLEDNMTLPTKVPNKRHPLSVIVVHPNNDIDYKEVTDTSQLKKFVGDQSKKYKFQYKNNHPRFLKLIDKKIFYNVVADVKKKAETNGMSKKEMVQDIIDNLKSR